MSVAIDYSTVLARLDLDRISTPVELAKERDQLLAALSSIEPCEAKWVEISLGWCLQRTIAAEKFQFAVPPNSPATLIVISNNVLRKLNDSLAGTLSPQPSPQGEGVRL